MGNCFSNKKPNPARENLTKRGWYEMVTMSIPVFVAAGVNNLVASIIEASSEEAEDHQGAEIGQQFLYTFFFSFLIGRALFSYVAKHIDACRSSTSIPDDSCGIITFCKRNKLLTLLARCINENAAFSIKEFMMLVLVEKVFEEHGIGVAAWGWAAGFLLFAFLIVIFSLLGSGFMRLEHGLLHWLQEYDIDAFALGVSATLVAIVAKGLSEVGVTFISPNSVLYGHTEDESDDNGLQGNSSAYNIIFTFGISFWCGILLIIEDKLRGSGKNVELEDDFAETLAIPINDIDENEGRSSANHERDENGDAHSKHEEKESVWSLADELISDYYHSIMGCICGVAVFLFLTDNIANILIGGSTNALAVFLASLFVAVVVFQRAPGCLTHGNYLNRATANTIKKNREYLENSKAANGSYKAADSSAIPSSSLEEGESTENQARNSNNSSANEGNVEEKPTFCEKICGYTVARYWSRFVDNYYRMLLHRRRLVLIAVRLSVGWTWEVVVAAFLDLVTESIDLTTGEEVGVRFAVVILILLISASVFYFFKDGDELYKVDPFAAENQPTRETELQSSSPATPQTSVNPMVRDSHQSMER